MHYDACATKTVSTMYYRAFLLRSIVCVVQVAELQQSGSVNYVTSWLTMVGLSATPETRSNNEDHLKLQPADNKECALGRLTDFSGHFISTRLFPYLIPAL